MGLETDRSLDRQYSSQGSWCITLTDPWHFILFEKVAKQEAICGDIFSIKIMGVQKLKGMELGNLGGSVMSNTSPLTYAGQ